jgi:hypothetical protein
MPSQGTSVSPIERRDVGENVRSDGVIFARVPGAGDGLTPRKGSKNIFSPAPQRREKGLSLSYPYPGAYGVSGWNCMMCQRFAADSAEILLALVTR